MPVKINIPSPLREHTQGKTVVDVNGATVKAVLDELCAQFPTMSAKLYDKGEVKPFLNIYLNDEDIRFLDGIDSPTKDGDDVSIIPAVAGG